jgi:hypothetical protein
MIIRVTAIVCLALVGILILYLPSAHPPERFLMQVRVEHEQNQRLWGGDSAVRIMARALTLYQGSQDTSPIPHALAANQAGQGSPVNAAVAAQMNVITGRFFSNTYFKSIDTLLLMALYRVSALIEWLPASSVFVLVALFDGLVRRAVKVKQFEQHSPELFSFYAAILIMVLCGTVVVFVVPVTLPSAALAGVPIAVGVCGGLSIAHFHRRGS